MSLIQCAECKQEVSTEAEICPHCGNPIHQHEIEEEKILEKRLRKAKRKAITGFVIIGLMFVGIYFYSGKIMELLFGKILSPQVISFQQPTNKGQAITLQEVKNLGYDFYVGQIESPNINNLTDDLKNQITKIAYDAHFPSSLLKNIPIIILNNLALTGNQYIPAPGGNLEVPELKPDWLSEGGMYVTFNTGSAIIFINKPIIAQGQLTEVLTHELGHAIGKTLTDQDWQKFHKLRNISSSTPRHGTNWNSSPEEDFAEVYKNTFTGKAILTYYGLLIPNFQDIESHSCMVLHMSLYSKYGPKVDTTDPMYMVNFKVPTSDEMSVIDAKVSIDPQMQACRRKTMNDSSQWTLGVPYKYTVSQATKDFILSIVARVNTK